MKPFLLTEWLEKNPGPYKVGDRVSYLRSGRPVEGVIVEDRGPLGVGGERIYAVKVCLSDMYEFVTEMPFSELQLIPEKPKKGKNGRQAKPRG